MEGGGDGHDIHLQVLMVLRSLFHVHRKDQLGMSLLFYGVGFGILHFKLRASFSHSPYLPTSASKPQINVLSWAQLAARPRSWISTWPRGGQRAAGAAEEGGSWGRPAGHLCHTSGAADGGFEPAPKTHLEEPGAPESYFSFTLTLRKPCSSCSRTHNFYCALIE